MKKILAVLVLIPLAAGCTESADGLSRDYRNLNNEFIDALMLVSGESRAKHANEKVLKTYTDRLGKIDKRVATWEMNRENESIAQDTLTSESVALYFAECQHNQKRLALERERIKKLMESMQARNPGADPGQEWPNLHEIASGRGGLQVSENL